MVTRVSSTRFIEQRVVVNGAQRTDRFCISSLNNFFHMEVSHERWLYEFTQRRSLFVLLLLVFVVLFCVVRFLFSIGVVAQALLVFGCRAEKIDRLRIEIVASVSLITS